ncbi:unnamed protein product, partial [Oikopleura dioica]
RSSSKAGSENFPVEVFVFTVCAWLADEGFVRPPAWRGFAIDEHTVDEKGVESLPV